MRSYSRKQQITVLRRLADKLAYRERLTRPITNQRRALAAIEAMLGSGDDGLRRVG